MNATTPGELVSKWRREAGRIEKHFRGPTDIEVSNTLYDCADELQAALRNDPAREPGQRGGMMSPHVA